MAQTHTWGTTFKSGNDSVSVPTETVTASGEAIIDETVVASASKDPMRNKPMCPREAFGRFLDEENDLATTRAASPVIVKAKNPGKSPRDIPPNYASGLNVAHVIAIDVSALKSLMIIASADMTLKTNSTSSPTNTLNVEANQLVRWTENSLGACPLTGDVTVIYVTSVAGGTLKVFALQDATP